MSYTFSKYHGAGNDFILMDNRDGSKSNLSAKVVSMLCHRHFGIGADGLILLESSNVADFKMVYFNSDGRLSSMCGNGARCIVLFANESQVENQIGQFEAVDGLHSYKIISEQTVKVSMRDVVAVKKLDDRFLIDTGSPHVVIPTQHLDEVKVYDEGKKIRNSPDFVTDGVNVNFVEIESDCIAIRTFERGVENETMACGTGCVAAAVWASMKSSVKGNQTQKLKTLGGMVNVTLQHNDDDSFTNISLEGSAKKVFEGTISE